MGKAIYGGTSPPSQIKNLVEDIKILAQVIKDIKFVYCSRLTNELADLIAKKAYMWCI